MLEVSNILARFFNLKNFLEINATHYISHIKEYWSLVRINHVRTAARSTNPRIGFVITSPTVTYGFQLFSVLKELKCLTNINTWHGHYKEIRNP